MSNTDQNYVEHLRRQLGFLRRSCESYDAGHVEEGVRIATTVRILIHETRNSTPLLRHLNSMHIRLVSTPREPAPDKAHMYLGLAYLGFDGQRMVFKPVLDADAATVRPLQVSEWWNEVVFILNPSARLTRRDIVLGAADKDGGAHVDASLDPRYGALATEGAIGTIGYTRPEGTYSEPISDAHLIALRQIGWEMLNSPELLRLAQ